MRRGRWLTSHLVLAVFCLPVLLCYGQSGATDITGESGTSVATENNSGGMFRGQPLVEQAVQIDNALRLNTDVEYFDQRFADILDEFARKYTIPILIHESALDGTSLTPDSPVTMRFTNVPLHSTLELILEKYHCTIAIHNDVLQIVSGDFANESMEKRIYDCSRLIESAASSDPSATLEKLQDVLMQSIDTDSWEVSGGNGQVSEFAGKLVISQTLTNHLAIERLLNGLYLQMK